LTKNKLEKNGNSRFSSAKSSQKNVNFLGKIAEFSKPNNRKKLK
jgi:hypothetical protein